jgi:hypothetical protein
MTCNQEQKVQTHEFFFFKAGGYCSCCTFDYKIVIVEAYDENHLEFRLKNEVSIIKYLFDSGLALDDDFHFQNSTSENIPDLQSWPELFEYFQTDTLSKIKSSSVDTEEYSTVYLGKENEAMLYLTKNYPDNQDGEKTNDIKQIVGYKIFQGERIYDDVQHTEYGRYIFKMEAFTI